MEEKYFYGNKISNYGLENGYVDYRTLAKAFDAVLNNQIINHGDWEIISGLSDNSDEIRETEETLLDLQDLQDETDPNTDPEKYSDLSEKISELQDKLIELETDNEYEIFQYYIVSDNAVEILQNAGEIVYYNAEFDMYVWGVTHYGTAWDYILTSIKIDW